MIIRLGKLYFQLPLGVILICGIPLGLISGSIIYQMTPYKQAQDQAWEKQYQDLSDKISHMDCPQLQKIRLDSIAGKPFDAPYGEHWGQIRDTYNALACGNHWGIWED